EKHATIELPYDILHQLYKDINRRIIECIKENPELLSSISNPEVIEKYYDKREKKREEIYNHINNINLNIYTDDFIREIFDDEDLI
ncbi:TPA: XRE family transcriptional regulator, partial [Staphylococcus delphini]|nr:XRE family transcriptional regulator [Staphylococcus delphini]